MNRLLITVFLIPCSAHCAAPEEAELRELCTHIAARNDYSSIVQRLSGERIDINNDGIKEVAERVYNGTMNVPVMAYKSESDESIEIPQMGFEWKDYWTHGLSVISYRGNIYTLNSYDDDGRSPAYLTYVTPENE